MKFIKIIILVVLTLLIFNCVSLMEKTGRILDGSAKRFKTISVYSTSTSVKNKRQKSEIEISVVEDKKKEKSIFITFEKFPMIKMRGSFPDENGSFFLTELEFLAGSTFGWNEYTLELIGAGVLKKELQNSFIGNTVNFNIQEIETVQITKGRIQRYDTRLTGNDALSALRNRYERILALTEWMKSLNLVKGQTDDEFEKYWEPILFPERVSKKKRPDGWTQDGDKFKSAESIKWNTGYTERKFPEELRPIRNSGTLLRDWEEAFYWIYLEYEWENIVELLSKGYTLIENK
jgi:hypothetical protein